LENKKLLKTFTFLSGENQRFLLKLIGKNEHIIQWKYQKNQRRIKYTCTECESEVRQISHFTECKKYKSDMLSFKLESTRILYPEYFRDIMKDSNENLFMDVIGVVRYYPHLMLRIKNKEQKIEWSLAVGGLLSLWHNFIDTQIKGEEC